MTSPIQFHEASVHCAFLWCCVKACPSPKLLEDLCELNLAAHVDDEPSWFVADNPELMCWFGRQVCRFRSVNGFPLSDVLNLQRLSPDGTETLLDHHLATFDRWLRAQFMYFTASSRIHYYLAVVTLLDQLDPKEYTSIWETFWVILQNTQDVMDDPLFICDPLDLFGKTESQIEFSRIVSKFLMDRERAGVFWVNSQHYADLARYILVFLRDK